MYGKEMKILRNKIDIRLVSNKNDCLYGHQNQATCHKQNLIKL